VHCSRNHGQQERIRLANAKATHHLITELFGLFPQPLLPLHALFMIFVRSLGKGGPPTIRGGANARGPIPVGQWATTNSTKLVLFLQQRVTPSAFRPATELTISGLIPGQGSVANQAG